MKQQTLAMAADQGAGVERFRRRTKREEFLDAINAIVSWAELCAVIEPHYPKAGNGRRPIGLERMLRNHLCAALAQAGRQRRRLERSSHAQAAEGSSVR